MKRNASTQSFVDWVTQKITENSALEDLFADEIVETLSHASSSTATPPPPQIATLAFQSGRKKLALKLLDCEPEPIRRVQSLLEWNEYRAAFVEASESGNPDLIYTVTLKLHEKLPFEEFTSTIEDFPMANTLYKKYCRRFDVKNLYDIYAREGNSRGQAQLFIRQALDENNLHMRASLFASAADAYRRSRDHFHASLCEDQSLLANFQKRLDESHAHHYMGMTIHETCAQLVVDKPNMADEFRSVFGIPERRFWRLRLGKMAESGQWAGLERLWKGKKGGCPLGADAFVEVCLEKDNREEAGKYLGKVKEKLKVKYYAKMGLFEEAAHLALKRKDRHGLLVVKNMCRKDALLTGKINRLIVKMDEANCHLWRCFNP